MYEMLSDEIGPPLPADGSDSIADQIDESLTADPSNSLKDDAYLVELLSVHGITVATFNRVKDDLFTNARFRQYGRIR